VDLVRAWTEHIGVTRPGVWPGEADPFGIHNLPYGAAILPGRSAATVVVRVGAQVLDLNAACSIFRPDLCDFVSGTDLNPLLDAGRSVWTDLRASVRVWVVDERHRRSLEPLLRPLAESRMCLPIAVCDYVDFYASEHHATNVGRLFRPGTPPLTPNWKHLPIGYHGRAGTIVLSGTEIIRPTGQRQGEPVPEFGPSQCLDVEVEVGFVLGARTKMGEPILLEDAGDHIFGVCLVNDWSARDIQSWESRPLGPFLGKSFATSISPWIVPLDALGRARVAPPPRDVALMPYLDDSAVEPGGFRIDLALEINGNVVSRPPFASMYWTPAQMLAHLTVNGASIRAGDLFASGTVSGPRQGEEGSLLELTRGGSRPLTLSDDSTRGYLLDGDEVVIRGEVPPLDGNPPIGIGEVRGRVRPAEVRRGS
jgi:fumarylacetoacetase